MGSWVERTQDKEAAGGPDWGRQWLVEQRSHIHVQINREEQLGSETDCETQVPVWEIKPQTSD